MIDQTWVCIERTTSGLRVSNLPGDLVHCFFTGGAHHPSCGEKWLVTPGVIEARLRKAMTREVDEWADSLVVALGGQANETR